MSWVWHDKKLRHDEPDWNAPVADAGTSRLEYIYTWERRCRGYTLHPHPVEIEPLFIAYEPRSPKSLLGLPYSPPQTANQALRHIALHFPLDQKVTPSSAVHFLQSLPGTRAPHAFEIVGTEREITYQLTTGAAQAEGVLAGARLHWPKAAIEPGDDVLERGLFGCCAPDGTVPASHSFVVDFGLLHFAYLPLASFETLAVDPLTGVLAGLSQVTAGEVAGLQVLFAPAGRTWNGALLQVVGEFEDENAPQPSRSSRYSRFGESEQMSAAKAKLASPLFAAVIRVFAVSGEGQSRAFELCKKVGGALGAFTNPAVAGNGLIALANHDAQTTQPHSVYPDDAHLWDVWKRTSHRSGMLISLPELAALAHPPAETLQHPKLVRFDPKERSLSDHLREAEGALLGLHPYRKQWQPLVWPDAYRNRHAYILGATRMGKSTLLHHLIAQDMASGRGLCLIDPHGDLALDVLAQVPPERVDDTIYLDLSDREHPLALGLLEARDDHEQRLLCSDILSVLKRLFAASWGDRLEHILRHAILSLLAVSDRNQSGHTDNGHTLSRRYTLRDIRPLLSNKGFRERIVRELDDPDLKAFWTAEFYGYSSSTFAPLYNKLGLLISSPLVRNIIAQRESKLSFPDLIQNKQILLVNLASSRIGNDNAHFLGALLVSKLQIAAMQSLRLGRSQRTPFTLYVDEFQNFVVSSFETILSEAGKAGLSLVMANQFLEQLSSNLQTAILSNVGTLASFRVSSDSGRLLEREFAGRFQANELVSLNRGEAVARVGSAADSYFMHTLPPPDPIAPDDTAQDHAARRSGREKRIVEQSRNRVCRLRADVEAELAAEAARQAAEQEAEERAEEERKRKTAEENKKLAEERKRQADEQKRLAKESTKAQQSLKAQRTVGTEQNVKAPKDESRSSPARHPRRSGDLLGQEAKNAKAVSNVTPASSMKSDAFPPMENDQENQPEFAPTQSRANEESTWAQNTSPDANQSQKPPSPNQARMAQDKEKASTASPAETPSDSAPEWSEEPEFFNVPD